MKSPSCRPSSTAPQRSRRPPSSPRSASASSSSPSSSSPARRESLFVPLGDGGRLRDAHVVLPVADARADDDALPPRREASSARGRGAASRGPTGARRTRLRFERGFERAARALRRAARPGRSRTGARVVVGFLALRGASLAPLPAPRAQTSSRASTRARSSCTCAAPPGTRIEETERLFAQRRGHASAHGHPAGEIDDAARQHRRSRQRHQPRRSATASLISSADGEILIALPRSTSAHARTTCASSAATSRIASPDTTFFFLPPDISTQVLNFGLPAPIDVQVVGASQQNQTANCACAREIARRIAAVPGAVDVHLAQVIDTPELRVDVDRTMAAQVGLTQRDVASDLLVSLSSSAQMAPNFWLDPKTRRPVPGRRADAAVPRSTRSTRCKTTPLAAPPPGGSPQLLANVAAVSRTSGRRTSRTTTWRARFDVQANVDGDRPRLGRGRGAAHRRRDSKRSLPRGTTRRRARARPRA